VPAGVTAVAVAQDRVDVSVVGPGARGVRVVELGGTPTVPAEDPDARAVRVRGVDGRFSPMLGELTWHERDQLVIVSSRSYTLPELLVFADAMRWT
jgi:hypothetical protein